MTVALAVVDHLGAILLELRFDCAQHSWLTMARSKAEMAAMAAEQTEYLVHLDAVASLAGGVPIYLAGRLVGGVGACGAEARINERVARAGLAALSARAAEPLAIPRHSCAALR